jgi:hypothetical protein
MPPAQFVSPYTDDLEKVPNETILFRMIRFDWIDWESQAAKGTGPRIKQVAFQDYRPEDAQRLGYEAPCMSVVIAPILKEAGILPKALGQALGLDNSYGVARLVAGEVRNLEAGSKGVRPAPQAGKEWHGIVFSKTTVKKTGAMSKALAFLAEWEVVPDVVTG